VQDQSRAGLTRALEKGAAMRRVVKRARRLGPKRSTASQVSRFLKPGAAANFVQKAAPRLVKVASITAISYALVDGAKRALRDAQNIDYDVRQTANGYHDAASLITVVRLVLLLDSNETVVSFQRVYHYLKHPEVVDQLVHRVCTKSQLAELFADRVEQDVRVSIKKFLKTYAAIDWGAYGRLKHFRNRGVAHLTSQEIKKRVTFAEIRRLVRSVVTLSECLVRFDSDGVAVRVDEIEEWSNRAKETWDAAFCLRKNR
jgi:hypothetical protein